MRGLVARRVADKALSVGEHSLVTASSLVLRDVSIGIASKDESRFRGELIEIINASVAGLASYQKKPEFGPATLIADLVEFVNTEQPALLQTGSTLLVDGKPPVEPADIDVESLYDAGVLGN